MANYLIEFDILNGHNPGTGATLPPDVLQLTGWRSIGAAQGGRFTNLTGVPIRSIYLRIADAANAFTITAESGGRLFNTIWTRTNDAGEVTEVYFLNGNIPSGFNSRFWMRVPRNTDGELQSCDAGQACPFEGKVLDQNPAFPNEPGWTVLHDTPLPDDPHLAELLVAAPSEFRNVDTFGVSDDGRHTLFTASGEVFLYDRQSKEVSRYEPPKVGTVPEVDSIRFDAEKKYFRLENKGKTVRRIRAEGAGVRAVTD